ncbi:MAG: helix-turn-helix domain-containing protein [Clostridia bacterium]|nr:helix-turn-helix domain-containing protein [Clostridia bacterium]
MEEIKDVFAGNLIRLRTNAGLTQAQLAETLNYSDKSVSKWERAEGMPDLVVAKAIADRFGVTVDWMLTSHDAWDGKTAKIRYSSSMVTGVCLAGIWTLAILLFLIFHWALDKFVWVVFLGAIPISLITLLVLNSVWRRERYHLLTVSALVASLFGLAYFIFHSYVSDLWSLIFLWIPAQLVVLLSFRIRKKKS